MKKRTAKAMPKAKVMTSDDHRKLATRHGLKSRMHEVKAEMLEVDEPPKKGKNKLTVRPY